VRRSRPTTSPVSSTTRWPPASTGSRWPTRPGWRRRRAPGAVLDVVGAGVGLHLHDTRSTALLNSSTAIERGVARFDTALGVSAARSSRPRPAATGHRGSRLRPRRLRPRHRDRPGRPARHRPRPRRAGRPRAPEPRRRRAEPRSLTRVPDATGVHGTGRSGDPGQSEPCYPDAVC
jgi:hypothetical protein